MHDQLAQNAGAAEHIHAARQHNRVLRRIEANGAVILQCGVDQLLAAMHVLDLADRHRLESEGGENVRDSLMCQATIICSQNGYGKIGQCILTACYM